MARYCKFFKDCKKRATYQIPYSKLSLCKEHYLENVEKRVKKLIEKKHMFHPNRGEKLLLALSGGKDSQVLLTIIKNIYPKDLEIHAIYIDAGISHLKYSQESKKIAVDLCKKLEIPFHTINIKEEVGFNVDAIHNLKRIYSDNNWKLQKNPFRGECSYCGAFKRYYINKFAAENGFTTVATGHNLTDEVTTLMNNFFNMDLIYLSRPGPKLESASKNLITRVKPFFYISEEEIIMYAYYANVEHQATECPFAAQAPNSQLKLIMNEIENYRRGNTISLVRQYYKKMQPIINAAIPIRKNSDKICNYCGRPTFSNVCKFCRMKRSLIKRFARVEENFES